MWPQFLEQYRFANCRGGEELTFRVHDPFLEWNNRTFSIRLAENGAVELLPEESVRPVELDIGTLTALLLSYKSPSYLQKMGRLKTDEETLKLLNNLIPKEKAYISDYI